MNGVEYMSVEHAYMSQKTDSKIWKDRIINAKTPNEAKQIGRSVKLIPNWDSVKEYHMLNPLSYKFSLPNLKCMLLDTGDAYLEETNTWGDMYWGVCNGVGKNRLGKMLMFLRKNHEKYLNKYE